MLQSRIRMQKKKIHGDGQRWEMSKTQSCLEPVGREICCIDVHTDYAGRTINHWKEIFFIFFGVDR